MRDCRIGALLAFGAELLRVSFLGGRLDYVNLRGATLAQTQFVDCRIAELDLGAAALKEVRFVGCRIDRLVLAESTLQAVDLRGAELTEVERLDRLAGATLTETQLLQLAPALAQTLGIRIENP